MSTVRMIYFAYFHAIMVCGIVLWSNTIDGRKVFLQQKQIISTVTGSSCRTTCKPLFQIWELLILSSQYRLSLMRFWSH